MCFDIMCNRDSFVSVVRKLFWYLWIVGFVGCFDVFMIFFRMYGYILMLG